MHRRSAAAENVYYVLNLLVSAGVIYGLVRLIGTTTGEAGSAQTITLVATYVAIILIYLWVAKGLLVGRVRGNGIRLSEVQFAEIYGIYREQLQKLGIRKEPRLYCVQSNGVLNAFATRMLFRHYVVVYSEILEAAYAEGREAVAFVLGHELGHIKRGHLYKNILIFPAYLLVPLRMAYSRACEYTCDSIGREVSGSGGLQGLLILAAGAKLASRVNVREFVDRSKEEKGFWVWLSEFLSSHPSLPKRIGRISEMESKNAF